MYTCICRTLMRGNLLEALALTMISAFGVAGALVARP